MSVRVVNMILKHDTDCREGSWEIRSYVVYICVYKESSRDQWAFYLESISGRFWCRLRLEARSRWLCLFRDLEMGFTGSRALIDHYSIMIRMVLDLFLCSDDAAEGLGGACACTGERSMTSAAAQQCCQVRFTVKHLHTMSQTSCDFHKTALI